jgi:outer membrane lipoprotein-sorting protein
MYVRKSVLGLAAVAFVALALTLVYVLAIRADTKHTQALKSYYFEARLDAQETGAPPGYMRPVEPRPNVIRAAYAAPNKWRYEFTSSDSARRDVGFTQVSDGQKTWWYEGLTNSYYAQTVPSGMAAYAGVLAVTGSFLVGPLPARSIDEFFGRYQLGGAQWSVAGTERLLGREVQRIEVQMPKGKTRLWIDPRYLFVLRYEAGEPGTDAQPIRAEVTMSKTTAQSLRSDSTSYHPRDLARLHLPAAAPAARHPRLPTADRPVVVWSWYRAASSPRPTCRKGMSVPATAVRHAAAVVVLRASTSAWRRVNATRQAACC